MHRKLFKAAAVSLAVTTRPSLLPELGPKKLETVNEDPQHPHLSSIVSITF